MKEGAKVSHQKKDTVFKHMVAIIGAESAYDGPPKEFNSESAETLRLFMRRLTV